MPRTTFDALPDTARLWIFSAERSLTPEDREALLGEVDGFLDQWAAHGQPLTCARDVQHDRFLMVAVDEEAAGVSGCSIDSLTRRLRELERRLGMALLDNGPVHYVAGDDVMRVSRTTFGDLAAAGTVTPDTVVFDNTVTTVGAVRAGQWERAARETWHGRSFFG
jgi:ligand-binding sensor domain-containing protein